MGKFIPVEPEKWAEMVKALALVAEMDKTINASQAECRRLKAEVERLRKAGDELLHEWSSGDETDARNFKKGLVLWNAAKEGTQS